MNGRIYDPLLGRMLSADVLVQHLGDLQSYNRYSYVRNNPLTFTDPTGWQPAEPGESPSDIAPGQVSESFLEADAEAQGLPRYRSTAEPFTPEIRNAPAPGEPTPSHDPLVDALTFHDRPAIDRLVAKIAEPSPTNENQHAAGSAADTPKNPEETKIPGVEPSPGNGKVESDKPSSSTALSEHRFTSPGESSIRYESDAKDYSRINPDGSVKPLTFAAPTSDGPKTQEELPSTYALPHPDIPRTNATTITPPAGTLVIGPRSVTGGTGNEVIYVNGAPPGSAGARQPVPTVAPQPPQPPQPPEPPKP